MKRVSDQEQLWYHRSFTIPSKWNGQRLLLHFGAVDWETTVYVNGREMGSHRGGYDAFTFDITDALQPTGDQELVVSVWDPTDAGYQPRGKQVRNPNGIWYTPTTGIWQTAWLEPVPQTHVRSLRITPDVDGSTVMIQSNVRAAGTEATIEIEILDGAETVGKASITDRIKTSSDGREISPRITLKVPSAKLWSPDSPFLYAMRISLLEDGRKIDEVQGYFGMRKIALAKDDDGILRLFLNNQPLFQYGPLDQGFWPAGLYTAPTDEALRYDIEIAKRLGFNMLRKHVKVEPARWYTWCDRLGMLVWQDMPSGDRHVGPEQADLERTEESAAQFRTEYRAMIDALRNHPSIVVWVPFNEGWGQFDTAEVAAWTEKHDPTRLVNAASGWVDRGVGHMHDVHRYPGPGMASVEPKRALVLGEFGGLGLPLAGHTWQDRGNWGYRSFDDPGDLTAAHLRLVAQLRPLIGRGLSAAVYTQVTDVEIEVNGLLTYDRAVVKPDREAVTAARAKLYEE
jgi:beta-galactosidase/beta-glucuronidase